MTDLVKAMIYGALGYFTGRVVKTMIEYMKFKRFVDDFVDDFIEEHIKNAGQEVDLDEAFKITTEDIKKQIEETENEFRRIKGKA
ncbi:TPA: hypothetical protein ACGO1T_000892 [Streptococcus suis]